MNTELSNLSDDTVLTVQELKKLIINSFKKQEEFERKRGEAMGEIGHNMP